MRRDFLSTMAAASRERVRAARRRVSEGSLEQAVSAAPAPPRLALERFDVIAELKRRSPAADDLAGDGFDTAAQLRAYAAGGACAVSVLTEPERFLGSLEDLERASALLAERRIPTLRKDFLTDPYQVLEARAAGAGGVLIIVTMLSDAEVGSLLAAARDCGLFALLEGFAAEDLARIARLDLGGFGEPVLAGVNCRDLTSLEVDFSRFAAMAAALPAGLPAVAESGIADERDIESVARSGYRLALVGSSLMRSADPAGRLARFVSAGRAELAIA